MTHAATVGLHLSVPGKLISQVSARQRRLQARQWGRVWPSGAVGNLIRPSVLLSFFLTKTYLFTNSD